jgi:hypothetical protein
MFDRSAASGGNTGDGIRMGMEIGAATLFRGGALTRLFPVGPISDIEPMTYYTPSSVQFAALVASTGNYFPIYGTSPNAPRDGRTGNENIPAGRMYEASGPGVNQNGFAFDSLGAYSINHFPWEFTIVGSWALFERWDSVAQQQRPNIRFWHLRRMERPEFLLANRQVLPFPADYPGMIWVPDTAPNARQSFINQLRAGGLTFMDENKLNEIWTYYEINPASGNGYWAVEYEIRPVGSIGGLMISPRAEVLGSGERGTTSGQPIPGLFAGGEVANGQAYFTEETPGAAQSFANTFGFIAGRQAANFAAAQ